MSWWGKLLGGTFGFMMGGPLGALLGAAFGHSFDSGIRRVESDIGLAQSDPERVKTAFFTTVFSVMGYLAKADGRVSEEEIKIAGNFMDHMQLDAEQRKLAIELFNQGKQEAFQFEAVMEQFRRECRCRKHLLQMFLEILIGTALADGELHPREREILLNATHIIGFSSGDFDRLLAMLLAQRRYAEAGQYGDARQKQASDEPRIADAYKALGLAENTSDAEVKKTYRRLMSQHHPDKLVAKGLPEEMIKLATEKVQEIRAAYDQIKRAKE